MRRLTLIAVLSLTIAAAAATAANAGHGSWPLEKAGQNVNGASPGEWLGRWWKAVLETPSPFERYPGCTPLTRRTIAVVTPSTGGEATCTVPVGATLVLVPDTTECDDYDEKSPYYGATPAARRRCAIGLNEQAMSRGVIVDDRDVRLTEAYRAQSPDGRATLPEDNLLEAPAGTRIRFGADGWLAFTKPLTRGRHEIVTYATGIYLGEPYDIRGEIHVIARGGH